MKKYIVSGTCMGTWSKIVVARDEKHAISLVEDVDDEFFMDMETLSDATVDHAQELKTPKLIQVSR